MISVGVRNPSDGLLTALKEMPDVAGKVSGIGDCLAPNIIQAAVFSGHAEARKRIGGEPKDGIYKRETPVLFAR